ncbi:ABC transporter C family member 2, partial [Tetrabaena socialis]
VSALVESRYNAVERLLSYADLAPEEDAVQAARPPPHRPAGLAAWPAGGALEFRDVWMSYRAGLEPVLQGVSFAIGDGEKVGIVGRTGSGKSSLVVALFRLVELQRGQMLLDGVDLRGLGDSAASTRRPSATSRMGLATRNCGNSEGSGGNEG